MVRALILTEEKQSVMRYEVPLNPASYIQVTDPVGATLSFVDAQFRTKGWVVSSYDVGEQDWEDEETTVLTIVWKYRPSVDKQTNQSG